MDTSTPNGRLVFGIFASIAEFERELILSSII
ncbi:MAG TPA: recombinase family protein [Candidatus Acidoferrales bacterium]|nr:recombinase family protein [Candidatus Acidoferrales bacterium]